MTPPPASISTSATTSSRTPQGLIFQELSSFALAHDLNISVKDLKIHATRIFERLSGELLSQAEAANLLGVSLDMLHLYRKDGLIVGHPKKPSFSADPLPIRTYGRS